MCYGNTQHLPRRSQRRRVATLVVFALIFPIREASASPTAANESNQQSTREESLPVEECQISDAAREALKNAWAVRVQTPEIPKFLELYQQAQTAAKPPECDSVKARMLADKARQLARAAAGMYLGLPNYRNNWLRLGFSSERKVRFSSTRK